VPTLDENFSAILFERVDEIYARVFRHLRPTLAVPEVVVKFHRFTNLTSNIRFSQGKLLVKISDLLEGAPAPVQEALAYILLSKLFRQPPPPKMLRAYKLYLSRVEIRRTVHLVRQLRGRKVFTAPQGEHFDLVPIFEDLNLRFFHGLMARPDLGWSVKRSRSILGHYDPSHHAIVLSKVLDQASVPLYVVEYVLYHEMLHLRHPVEHKGAARRIHTRDFQSAEKQFPLFAEARAFLKGMR
jgi:hypothetical protein